MDSEPFERKRSSTSFLQRRKSSLSKKPLLYDDEEEDEETKQRRLLENEITLPLSVFCLTFLFPPLGFLFFLKNRHLNHQSRRYLWFRRSLGLGSALSVIYTLILCSVLHHTTLYKSSEDVLGYGYE